MKVNKDDMILYAITDRKWLGGRSLSAQVEEAIKGGATFIQLREKNLSFKEFVEEGKEVKAVTDKYSIPLVINDNIDVALAIEADGVHLGQSDEELLAARRRLGENKIIGVSAHNTEEARKAEAGGADYLGVGDLFGTGTKKNTVKVTGDILTDICASVKIPVVGIGGISKDNITNLMGTGISGVAVISAIFSSDDIEASSKELRALSEAVRL